MISKTCKHCGGPFEVAKPSEAPRRKFCSKRCFYAGRDNPGMTGKKHRAETLVKLARRRVHANAEEAHQAALASVRRHYARKRSTETGMLENRLRAAFGRALKGMDKPFGCFRHLDYTPAELREHIAGRLAACGFACPMCGRSLMDGFDVDHKMPLSTATTVFEVVKLFALDNLDVLCPPCNRHRKRARVAV